MFSTYFQDIFKTAKAGDATEPSFYSALKNFLEALAAKKNRKISVTPLPKKTEAGNPDFRVWDGRYKIIGYIEAKAPEIENLTEVEGSEQLKRYRKTFPNLILTNFFEFRLYRNGKQVSKVKVGNPFVLKMGTVPPFENAQAFETFFEQFLEFSLPRTFSARSLAIELAKRTRFLRDEVIAEELKEEEQKQSGYLLGFYKAFKDHLIASLTPKDFADLYAQTITYGLFAARSRAENGFNRKLAYDYIPRTIGILRDVFKFVSFGELPTSMKWIVDDIAEVLAVADVKKIISDFYKEGKGRDPIIHFYETFLAEYDPAEREKRGVYYTPEPVVGYIVRSIHKLLRKKFGKEDGFATQSVTVLDPAAGTLTFVAEAIHQAVEEYKKKYGDGGIKGLIKDHILKDFYAFELMMAPYAVGHLKIGFVLDEFGYKLSQDERFNLYLTNTLEFTKEDPNKLPGIFEQTIAKESGEALEIKEQIPIMVIIGNPPYSGISENKGEWILKQIEEYKRIEGKSLGERNPKWIQDDYVKFFRFAQWKIEKIGAGILGFITNHAWLDNPTFRGMRASLVKTFDEIYILNLHGSTLKKEKTPEGGKDENVFDIQPGVAISILVKGCSCQNCHSKMKLDIRAGFPDRWVCENCGFEELRNRPQYADLWGLREEKYDWLEKNNIEVTKWQTIYPTDPYYFFVPREEKGWKVYQNFWKVTDIFPVNSVGIVTARDKFTIHWSEHKVWTTISNFSSYDPEYARSAYNLGPDARDWKVELAQKDLKESGLNRTSIVPISYRPFDIRYTYYTGRSRGFHCMPRPEVMQHMLRPNLALTLCRQYTGDNFYHILVADTLVESCYISNKTKEIGYILPLYLYNKEDKQQQISLLLQNQPASGKKEANINVEIQVLLNNTYNPQAVTTPLGEQKSFDVPPEEIFYYIYAVLYSNTYRHKYQEFLKIDFPRIPFTKDYKLFQKLAQLGKQLVDLHLLKSPELNNPIAKFYGKDSNRVEKRDYNEKERQVYINDSQYFEGIESEVWSYYIGGYQVLDKWLKDRKGRTLSSEDIKHYCKVVTTLKKTIEIQEKIDELYPRVEKNLIRL